ncbi:MAG: hypothetical protein WBA10_08475 [Elainellaceae cyanobacterium]
MKWSLPPPHKHKSSPSRDRQDLDHSTRILQSPSLQPQARTTHHRTSTNASSSTPPFAGGLGEATRPPTGV